MVQQQQQANLQRGRSPLAWLSARGVASPGLLAPPTPPDVVSGGWEEIMGIGDTHRAAQPAEALAGACDVASRQSSSTSSYLLEPASILLGSESDESDEGDG